jgi:ribosome-binding factor A
MIRHLAVERINMRYAMELKFMPDPSIEESFRLGEILKKIHTDEEKDPKIKS